MSVPASIQKQFLSKAHSEVSFPDWQDSLIIAALENELDVGATFPDAANEVINQIGDGVLL